MVTPVPRRLARAIVAAALCQNAEAPEMILEWEEASEEVKKAA